MCCVISLSSYIDSDNELDDATVAEGDEHRIIRAPQARIMCVENPESYSHTMCAEEEKPLNIITDVSFEAMSNPDIFPYITGTFSSK